MVGSKTGRNLRSMLAKLGRQGSQSWILHSLMELKNLQSITQRAPGAEHARSEGKPGEARSKGREPAAGQARSARARRESEGESQGAREDRGQASSEAEPGTR